MGFVDRDGVVVVAGEIDGVTAGVDEPLDPWGVLARRFENVEGAAQVNVDEPVVGNVVRGQRGAEVADRVNATDGGHQVVRCLEVTLDYLRPGVAQPCEARITG